MEESSGDAERAAAVGTVPVFGRDRLPEGKRWNSRSQVSLVTSEAAWSRFIRTSRKMFPEVAAKIEAAK